MNYDLLSVLKPLIGPKVMLKSLVEDGLKHKLGTACEASIWYIHLAKGSGVNGRDSKGISWRSKAFRQQWGGGAFLSPVCMKAHTS